VEFLREIVKEQVSAFIIYKITYKHILYQIMICVKQNWRVDRTSVLATLGMETLGREQGATKACRRGIESHTCCARAGHPGVLGSVLMGASLGAVSYRRCFLSSSSP